MQRKFASPLFATFLLLFAALTVGASPLSRGAENGLRIATFAGGCFWCVEADFDKVPGVVLTVSGYTGGSLKNPTYKQVSAGGTGHREAVQIFYDPKKVTYAMLLDVLWHSVDPTDGGGQFCDRGESYGTAIFADSPEQKRLAEDLQAQTSGIWRPETAHRHPDRGRRGVLSGRRTTIRIITRRVPYTTNSTAIDAVATRVSGNSGARTRTWGSRSTRFPTFVAVSPLVAEAVEQLC